jgi:hypothetical protein
MHQLEGEFASSYGMERNMKSLAIFVTAFVGMSTAAQAKSGLEALDSITGIFSAAGNNSSWLIIAAVAFVIYIAGSAHRA